MVLETAAGLVLVEPSFQVLLSLCSLVTLVSVLTACVCCKRPTKHRDDDPEDAYGVIPASAGNNSPRINFRFGHGSHSGERHSQPNMHGSSHPPNAGGMGPRSSAPLHPPRGLPPALPTPGGDLYAPIDKRVLFPIGKSAPRAIDDIDYADGEEERATYETIDADSDMDPMYSKVDPRASGRRYDYPQFRRGNSQGRGLTPNDPSSSTAAVADPTYQSASQIYAPGSEDPYSSIASGPRGKQGGNGTGIDGGGGDDSSNCDPGYARVRSEGVEGNRGREGRGGGGPSALGRVDSRRGTERSSDDDPSSTYRVERELDQLYSVIRRRDREWDEPERPVGVGGGQGDPLGGRPGGNGGYHTVEERAGSHPRDVIGGGGDDGGNGGRQHSDDQSIASRDPSYRYLAVRESTDALRERLTREGVLTESGAPAGGLGHGANGELPVLGGPRREHYYSTIGGVYETVDGSSLPPSVSLAVRTSLPASRREADGDFVPLPPTSPIPDRTSQLLAGQHSPRQSGVPASAPSGTTTISIGGSHTSLHHHPGSSSSRGTPLYAAINKPTTSHPIAPSPATIPHHHPHSSPHSHQGNGEAPGATPTRAPAPQRVAVGPRMRGATIVVPEEDEFARAPKVVMREGGTRPTSFELSGGEKRRSTESATQTPTRPTVIKEPPPPPTGNGSAIRERRPSPTSVTREPLMTSSTPISHPMANSINDGTLIARRVVEERETIVESMTVSSSSSLASDDERGIALAPQGREYSARETHTVRSRHDSGGSYSAREPRRTEIGRERERRDGTMTERSAARSTSFDRERNAVNGDVVYHVPITLSGSSQSLGGRGEGEEERGLGAAPRSAGSSRSSLPIRQSSEDLSKAHERSRQRRRESEERAIRGEGREGSGSRERRTPTTPRANSRTRKEREEELKRRLGTIYTGRDYVSPVDMGTQRGWPLVAPSSPPSLRREIEGMRVEEPDDELTPRAPVSRPGDRLNNNSSTRNTPIVNGQFTCDLSSSEESLIGKRARYGGGAKEPHLAHCPAAGPGDSCGKSKSSGAGGEGEGAACYCHTMSPREEVWNANYRQMEAIHWGRPFEEIP